jgi:hypothetical protein
VTQTVTAPRAAVPAMTPPNAADVHRRDLRAARRRRGSDAIRRYLEGTPGRLRIAAAVAVLSCVVFALLGASAFQARGNALAEARADAAQLVRVQQIATSVVQADSLFTNGYLASGLETSTQRTLYDTAIGTASRSIAQAAAANPADAPQLATVSQQLNVYTARVASARANNALGFQAATGYLRQASDQLRGSTQQPQGVPAVTGMLPTLDKLITVNTQRVDDAYSAAGWASWRLVAAGILAIGGLALVQVRLARTTHRYVNVPLAAASLAVVVMLIAGGVVMATAQRSANDVKDQSYAATLALAKARIAAYSGKSQESIALIYLGTGGNYAAAESSYQKNLETAKTELEHAKAVTGSDPGLQQLDDWDAQHKVVYQKGVSDWVTAARDATQDQSVQKSVNGTFNALETSTFAALSGEANLVDKGLASRYGLLVVTGWLTLVIGLIAAGAAWVGISQRLEEYR